MGTACTKQSRTEPKGNLKGKIVVLVVGGPGSEKSSLCERIVKKYDFTYISTVDLLRAEAALGSTRGEKLQSIMEKGELVPNSVVLELIRDNMNAHKDSKGFLIDGCPCEVQQAIEFESKIAPCTFVLWVDTSQETMVKRLLHQAKPSGRDDDSYAAFDNEATIRKRLQTFVESTEPVLEHYRKVNKVRRVDSERSVDEVFAKVQQVFSEFVK